MYQHVLAAAVEIRMREQGVFAARECRPVTRNPWLSCDKAQSRGYTNQ